MPSQLSDLVFWSCQSAAKFCPQYLAASPESVLMCPSVNIQRVTTRRALEANLNSSDWHIFNGETGDTFRSRYEALDGVVIISLQYADIDWATLKETDGGRYTVVDDGEVEEVWPRLPGKSAAILHHYTTTVLRKPAQLVFVRNTEDAAREIADQLSEPVTGRYGIVFISHCDGVDSLRGQVGLHTNTYALAAVRQMVDAVAHAL